MWRRLMVGGKPVPILVVDDDPAFRFVLASHLRGHGVEPIEADSTLTALEVLDRRPEIERALVDVRMPAGVPHGLAFALMAKHQTRPRERELRCVLMSAFAEYAAMEEFRSLGGVLTKHADMKAFVAAAFARLESRPEPG